MVKDGLKSCECEKKVCHCEDASNAGGYYTAVNDVTINGIFGAGGDTLFDMYSLAVCMWCLAIPLAAAGTYFFHWPVVLVYACTCIDEVGKLPWVLHHFRKYKWVKDLTH